MRGARGTSWLCFWWFGRREQQRDTGVVGAKDWVGCAGCFFAERMAVVLYAVGRCGRLRAMVVRPMLIR